MTVAAAEVYPRETTGILIVLRGGRASDTRSGAARRASLART